MPIIEPGAAAAKEPVIAPPKAAAALDLPRPRVYQPVSDIVAKLIAS
jgi:hypothetical protein